MNNQWFSKEIAVWLVVALVLSPCSKQFDRAILAGAKAKSVIQFPGSGQGQPNQIRHTPGTRGGTEILAITTDDQAHPYHRDLSGPGSGR